MIRESEAIVPGEIVTYAIRYPGRETMAFIVEATSLKDALKDAPAGSTGSAIFRDIAFMLCERGVAFWPQQEAREWEATNREFDGEN